MKANLMSNTAGLRITKILRNKNNIDRKTKQFLHNRYKLLCNTACKILPYVIMATSIPSSKRILANSYELLSNQNECVEWWFGFNTKNKDLNNKYVVQPTRAPNKYSLTKLSSYQAQIGIYFFIAKF